MAQQSVLLIGGAGAQGVPIAEALSKDPQYAVRVYTRNPSSETAQSLSSLPNVTIVQGDSHNESDLRKAFKGVNLAFVNLNSHALGIRAEMYWGTRIYDIAIQSGVKHFIWSTLDDGLVLSGYDEDCRVSHYDGKSRVTAWLKSKPQTPMKWSILTTGPYIEMLSELLRPKKENDGTWVFRYPLKDGAVPFIHLDDIGRYVHWQFSNPSESVGVDLQVVTEHASGEHIASTFTEVTGQPARYESIPTDQWFSTPPGPPEYRIGQDYEGNGPNDPTLMTIRHSFGNWWHMYQRSAGNTGLIQRDYALLDRILPDRVRTVGEWMKKVGYSGERKLVLKTYSGH